MRTHSLVDYHELSPKELGTHTWESISARYRKNKPVCLLTPLEHLESYVVLNVFAPSGAALWSVGYGTLHSACRNSIQGLYKDPTARPKLMKDLRAANIRTVSPQVRLVERFVDVIGASKSTVESLSVDRPYAESWRYWSSGVRADHLETVLRRLENEVEQFSEAAFFGIDESVILADPTGRSSVGCHLFQHVGSRQYASGEIESMEREVLKGLEHAVRRLEAGLPFDTPIEPIWMIKGCLSIWFPGYGRAARDEDEEVELNILVLRARLVRLLGWPHQYRSVMNEVARIEPHTAGVGSPYDAILAELREYVREMQRRYPMLAQDLHLG